MPPLYECSHSLRLLGPLGLLVLALPGLAENDPLAKSSPTAARLTFEEHIRPIFKANCFDCHGEGEKLKGELDLRLRRLTVKGGESGPAIVPGKPEKSLLYEKIAQGEMPKREKKLTAEQIALIKKWIAAGAPTVRREPGEIGQGMAISPEERAFWSFQPIRRAPVPKAKASDRVRTPIDAFLLAAMKKRGLAFSTDADKLALLRRAHLDLIGLPPTPTDVVQFLTDDSPDAYERMINGLLSSPHYGERWGRHWLDAAGYADSDGYTDADPPRDHAWKYRDYVIRAFQADKPFNQFILEQLAGDELAGVTPTNALRAVANPPLLDALIATGFLRMAADGTAVAGGEQDVARNQVISDTIKIVSTSLLGLSVGCAQCHDHRFDPIPQADYYRLRAVFEPAYDWKHWRTPAQRLISLYTEADRAKADKVEAEAQKMESDRVARQKQLMDLALENHLKAKFQEPLRSQLSEVWHTAEKDRTAAQKKLLEANPSANLTPGTLYLYDPKAAEELKGLDGKIAEARQRKPPEELVAALTETPGVAPVTYLFHRGDSKQPQAAIGPGALTVLAPEGKRIEFPEKDSALPTTGRRLAFARWLTSGTNPLVARVLVNRVWMHHFGRGLVGTPADFGAMGEKPTHPELLDWLAGEFVAQGWSMKQLHKLIMTSSAYRQSSLRDPKRDSLDPDNRLYSRQSVQRLDAEAIRDSILAASGAINRKMFGPPVPVRTDIAGQVVVGIDKTEGDNKMPVEVPMHGEEFRRSVYIQVRRSRPLALLNAFDAPVMEVNCERRQSSTVSTQALMLMNSGFILEQAGKFAERLRRETGDDTRGQVIQAMQLAFARPATAKEIQESVEFISRQIAHLKSLAEKAVLPPSDKKDKEPPKKVTPEEQALTDFCQTLLSANEFLYVD